MAEWSKAHDWKSCVPPKGTVGSNPTLSAIYKPTFWWVLLIKISLSQQDELKNDINVVTHSLVDKVALRPEILQEITPRQFEELVCELFERKGYNVQLTKQTRDGGKDLIVLNNSMLGDLVIYAECKKKAPKHPVNVGLVRQLYGTVEADRVTAGIMVTNSYFSKDARRFQQTIKSRMNLIDYSELMKQIMDCR